MNLFQGAGIEKCLYFSTEMVSLRAPHHLDTFSLGSYLKCLIIVQILVHYLCFMSKYIPVCVNIYNVMQCTKEFLNG